MMQNTEHTAAPLLVRGGRVHDAVHPEPQQIDLLLENGRIAESGSHTELLQNHGLYERLWNAQQSLENYGKEGDAR